MVRNWHDSTATIACLFLLMWLMGLSIQLGGLHTEIHALRKDLAERDKNG